MCDLTTHPMLLEDVRRTRIMFHIDHQELETARSSTSYTSNVQYGYSEPDYYELKQDETRDTIELTTV